MGHGDKLILADANFPAHSMNENVIRLDGVDIKDAARKDAVCEKCEDENKNRPILGLNILTGLEKDGEEWSGGNILDPRNGKIYKCYIKLIKPNKLKLRG